MSELRKKKYITGIIIIVLLLCLVGLFSLGKVDKYKGLVKVSNAKLLSSVANTTVMTSKGTEEKEYTVNYTLDPVTGITERDVIIKGKLNSDYASFKEINKTGVTSTLSNNGKEIEVHIENVRLGEEQELKLKIQITNAPDGETITPEIKIKEATGEETTVVGEPITVETNSVQGMVYDENMIPVGNIELSISKDGQELKRTYTSDNGSYIFSDLEQGSYIIKVEEEIYEIVSGSETSESSQNNIIKVKQVDKYNIETHKYIEKLDLVINGKKQSYTYKEAEKVIQTIKNAKTISGEIEYKLVVKNKGDKATRVERIEDTPGEGLEFKASKNSGWEEEAGKIIYKPLSGVTLESKEKREIKIVLDITSTKEIKTYINKMTTRGKIEEKIVYIVDGQVKKEQKVAEGDIITKPNLGIDSLDGWYTDSNFTNKYNFSNRVNKNLILYARTDTPVNEYTVRFIDQGQEISSVQVLEGEKVSKPANDPVVDGYTFECWTLNGSCYNFDTEVNQDIDLISKYNIKQYTVTFKDGDSEYKTELVNYNELVQKPANPTKQYYTFTIWTKEDGEEFIFTTPITDDIVLNANYVRNTHSITFTDKNPSTSVETPIKTVTIDEGEVVTEETAPEYDGYTFKCWESNGTCYDFNTLVTKDLDLVNSYNAIEYSISYDYDGGTLEEGQINPPIYTVATPTFDLYNPSKTGYTFLGWKDLNTNVVSNPTTITVGTINNKSYKAIFQINQDQLEIDPVGGIYSGDLLITKDYGSIINIGTPEKTGYTFTGWELTGAGLYNNGIYTFGQGNGKLTAQYSLNEYDITYDYTSCHLTDEEITALNNKTKYTVEDANFPVNNPNKYGYDFTGWTGTDLTDKTTSLTVDTSKAKNLAYVANCNLHKFTVSYYSEGSLLSSEQVNYQEHATRPATDPNKTGYTFKHWSLEENGAKYNFDTETIEIDTNLYAVFTKDEYQIDYDLDGGSIEIANPETYSVDSEPIVLNKPTKTGYTFTGWIGTGLENKTMEVTIPTGSTGNRSYTATYLINQYNVDFYDMKADKTYEKIEGQSLTKDYNTTFSKTDTPTVSLSGYTFDHWSLTQNGEEYNYSIPVTNNVVLYAVYKIDTYEISYDLDDGSLAEGQINPPIYTIESEPINLYKPTKEGHTFTGWTGTGLSDKTLEVTIPTGSTGNRSYTATYSINQYQLEIDPAGGEYEGELIINNDFGSVVLINTPTKAGYRFTGWELTGSGSYSNGSYTFEAGNGKLTATYSIIEYTVSYEGITDEERELLSNPISYTVLTPSIDLNNPANRLNIDGEGEVFVGWKEANDTTPSMLVTLPPSNDKLGNKTYTAIWNHRSPDVYDITYNLNGGTLTETNPTSYKKSDLPIDLYEPTKIGYTFTGWTGSNGTTPTKNYKIPTTSEGNLNYTANYSLNTYSITYNYDSCHLTETEITTLNNKTSYTVEDSNFDLVNPNKYGYDFTGWTGTDQDELTTSLTVNTSKAKDLAYVANCNLHKFTVSYYSDGNLLSSEQVDYQGHATKPTNPNKTGYTFKHWSLEENGAEYNFNTETIERDTNLYAVYQIVEYELSYDLDDGSLAEGQINPSTYTVETDTFDLYNPTKEGYTFLGWKEASSDEVNNPTTITKGTTGNKSFTAQYEINQYQLEIDPNGGSYSGDLLVTKDFGFVLHIDEPTKNGYTFTGWTLTGAGSYADEYYTYGAGNGKLTAQYSLNTYNVTYNYDSCHLTEEEIAALNNKTSYTVEDSNFDVTNPTKYGYDFTGWTGTDLTSSTTSLVVDTSKAKDLAYVANCNLHKFTVSYYSDGSLLSSEQVEYQGHATKPTDPSKTGYTFKHWSLEENGAEYNFDTEIIEANTNLYAVYEIVEYDINYDLDGGSIATANPDKYTIESDSITLTNPTKEGYTFLGWTGTGLSGNTKDVTISTGSTGDRSYTAHFEVNKYLLEIDPNGGTYSGDLLLNQDYGTTADIADPVKTGYRFTGWTLTGEGTFENGVYTFGVGNGKLEANYEVITYNISYDYTSCHLTETEITALNNKTSYTVEEEDFPVTNPSKYGYDFTGWTGTDLTEAVTSLTVDTAKAKNLAYVANCNLHKFNVDFNNMKSDGTYEKVTGASLEVEYNDSISVSDAPTVTLRGYTFNNWSLENDTNPYDFSTPIIQDTNLYATYTKDVYNITYNYAGGALDEGVTNRETYTVDTVSFELNEPKKTGYNFTGWTGTDLTEPTKPVTIAQGSVGNRTYTANYEKQVYTVTYMDDEVVAFIDNVEYEGTTTPPAENPTKDHGIFKWWSLSKTGTEFNYATPITENLTLYAVYEEVEAPTITHALTTWVKDKVTVTVSSSHDDYSYKYKDQDGIEHDYTGPFDVTKNCTVYATSIKDGITSLEASHDITNIDKINPTIIDITNTDLTPVSATLTITAQDNESGMKNIKIYVNSILPENLVHTSDDFADDLNEEKEYSFTVTELEQRTTYTIIVVAEDVVGNTSSDSIEITTPAKHYVARVVGPTYEAAYDDQDESNYYETLAQALNSDTCQGASCVIQMLDDIEETNTVLNGKDVTIDLNGLTISALNENAFTNNGTLKIIDKNEDEIGKVESLNGTAIINNGTLFVGENETVLQVDPNEPIIEGSVYGIDNKGELHFLDGKIIGASTSGALKGTAPITPYSYNASVGISGDKEIATLEVIADAEARINSVYYTKAQQAVDSSKKGSYETPEGSSNIMSQVQSKSDYRFVYDETTGTLKNDNQGKNGTTASSYIVFDMTSETTDKILSIDASISTANNRNIGYIHLKNTNTPSSYSDEIDRLMVMTNTSKDNVNVILEKGKKYYLYFGSYRDNSGWNPGEDTFTINSIKLSDYTLSDESGNLLDYLVSEDDYHFIKRDDGSYVNRNNPDYSFVSNDTTAHSYLKFDLTNELNDKLLYVNMSTDGMWNTSNAYVTVTNTADMPPYDQEEGRAVNINSNTALTSYEVVLKAGEVNYVHFGAHRTTGNIRMIINSLVLEDKVMKDHLNSDINHNGTYYMYETDHVPTIWKDISGNDKDAIMINTSYDETNQGMIYNGTNSYVIIPNGITSETLTSETVEVEYSTTDTKNQYLYKGSNKEKFFLFISNGGTVINAGQARFALPSDCIDGNKHKITMVCNEGTYSAYFDGVALELLTGTSSAASDANTYIGVNDGNRINGSIYSVKTYNRALDESEITGTASNEGLLLHLDGTNYKKLLDNPAFINNNQYIANTSADSYMIFDLTGLPSKTIYVNADISSQSGYDYGCVYVNDSTSEQACASGTGRFVYISGETEAQEYPVTLTGNKLNYVHFRYQKNNATDSGSDTFKINYVKYYTDSNNTISKYIFSNSTTQKQLSPAIVINHEVDTVELLKNITVTDPLEVEDTRDVVLDLRGYTLTNNKSDYVINNEGYLTIIDSDFDAQKNAALAKYASEKAVYDTEYETKIAEEQEYYSTKQAEYTNTYNSKMEEEMSRKENATENYNEFVSSYLDYMNSDDYDPERVFEFEQMNAYQKFTAPYTGEYKIELWGAQGNGIGTRTAVGGKGGYTSGNITLQKGDTIYVYVGEHRTDTTASFNAGSTGGTSLDSGNTNGYGGGGATDIRLVTGAWNDQTSLASRIMVAAGGGGSSEYNSGADGGFGGGLTGGSAITARPDGYATNEVATGGTQTSGGSTTTNAHGGSNGSFGVAGNGNTSWGSGGGGGYYGGAGGGWNDYRVDSGAGGSSYISGHTGSVAITAADDITPKTGCLDGTTDVTCSYHYSGKKFTDTVIKDGSESMPTHDGTSTMTGNEGNGYAKITYVDTFSSAFTTEDAAEEINNFKKIYNYKNRYQEFTAPVTADYKIEAWGAQGGSSASYTGGKGAYTKGTIRLTKGQKLYIYVGEQGSIGTEKSFNGGGASITGPYYGGSGGGATDIRLISGDWDSTTGLASRIMVASGGGGASYYVYGDGGAGGALTGYNGTRDYRLGDSIKNAAGGTQTSGGSKSDCGNASYCQEREDGGFGYGGNATQDAANTSWYKGGGGGSGYYGGGGGADGYAFSGAGGSSYISGYLGSVAIQAEDNTNPKYGCENGTTDITCSYHYSGKKFTDTVMKSGNESMPSYDDSGSITGNTGNGHVRITYAIEDEYIVPNEKQDELVTALNVNNYFDYNSYLGNNTWKDLKGGEDALVSGAVTKDSTGVRVNNIDGSNTVKIPVDNENDLVIYSLFKVNQKAQTNNANRIFEIYSGLSWNYNTPMIYAYNNQICVDSYNRSSCSSNISFNEYNQVTMTINRTTGKLRIHVNGVYAAEVDFDNYGNMLYLSQANNATTGDFGDNTFKMIATGTTIPTDAEIQTNSEKIMTFYSGYADGVVTKQIANIEPSNVYELSDYISEGLELHLDGFTPGDSTSTTWKDISGNDRDATVENAKYNSNLNGYALTEFNSSLYISPSSISTPDAETVEILFSSTLSGNRSLYDGNSNEKIGIAVHDGYIIVSNSASVLTYYVPTDFFDGKIKALTCIYKDGDYYLYYNNQLLERRTNSNYLGKNTTTYIGRRNDGYNLNGNIYSVRVYNRALEENERTENFDIDVARYNIDAELERRVPTLDKTTLGGNISSTSYSIIYNAYDAYLDVKQAVINVEKQGTNFDYPYTNGIYYGIYNNGTVKLEEDSVINLTKNRQIGIYNSTYGKIDDSPGTINMEGTIYDTIALYNASKVDTEISGLKITSNDSYNTVHIGIMEAANVERTYKNIDVRASYAIHITNKQNEKVTIKNSKLVGTGTGDKVGALYLDSSDTTAKEVDLIETEITGYINTSSTNYRNLDLNKVTMDGTHRNIIAPYNKGSINISNNSSLTNSGVNIENGCNMTIKDTNITNTGVYRETTSISNSATGDNKLELENVNIKIAGRSTEYYGRGIYNTGTLVIKGGSIIADLDNSGFIGIDARNEGSKITITGNFEMNKNFYTGISLYKGSLTLGENDSSIGNTYPLIMGKSYGLYNLENNTFNFYDGKIVGPIEARVGTDAMNSAIYGTITELADNSDLNYNVNGKFEEITLRDLTSETEENYVARIGSNKYTSIQRAVNAVTGSSETEIELIKDIYTAEKVDILEGKNIIIDENNHNIKTYKQGDYITNSGTLHFTDDTNNVTKTNTSFSASFIKNNGNLTYSKALSKPYNGNLIENAKNATTIINSGKLYTSNHNNAKEQRLINNDGILTINNGKLYDEFYGGNAFGKYAYLLYNNENGEVTINNGDFRKYRGNGEYCAIVNNNKMVVNDGFFMTTAVPLFYNTKTLSEEDGLYGLKVLGGTYPYAVDSNQLFLRNTGSALVKNITNNYARLTTNTGTVDIENVKHESNANKIDCSFPSTWDEDNYYYCSMNTTPVDTNVYSYIYSNGTINIKDSSFKTVINSYFSDLYGNAEMNITNTKLELKEGTNPVFKIRENSSLNVKDCIDYTDPDNEENNLRSSIRLYAVDWNANSFEISGTSNLKLENTEVRKEDNSENSGSLIYFSGSGNLDIISGSYYSEKSNCVNNLSSGIVTIGKKIIPPTPPENPEDPQPAPEVPDQNSPRIEGLNYGLNTTSTTSTVNFYDGRIVGGTAINGDITEIETGFDLIRDINADNKEEKYLGLVPPIINITMEPNKEYDSIDEAFSEARNNDVLQVQREITTTAAQATITIPSTKKITLDFNGHKIIQNNTKLFINEGEFILKDSTATTDANGIKVSDGGVESNSGTIVDNKGKLAIESGTYFTTKAIDDLFINEHITDPDTGNVISIFNINNGYIYNGQTRLISNAGKLNINNGKVAGYKLTNDNTNFYHNMIDSSSTGEVTINNGYIIKTATYHPEQSPKQGFVIYSDGTVTINDGNFVLSGTNIGYYFEGRVGLVCNDDNGQADILGGTYTSSNKSGVNNDVNVKENAAFIIKNYGNATVKDIELDYLFGDINVGKIESNEFTGGILTIDNVKYNQLNSSVIINTGKLTFKNSEKLYGNTGLFSNSEYGELTIDNCEDIKITYNSNLSLSGNSKTTIKDSNIISERVDGYGTYNIINMIDNSELTIDASKIKVSRPDSYDINAAITSSSSGDINIKSGEVYSASPNAIRNTGTGTINVGVKNDALNTDFSDSNPKIEGSDYGIYSIQTATTNLYDGVLIGGTKGIYGTINEIETGKHINKSIVSSKENIYLGNAKVFEVGSNQYQTLNEAITAASNNDTITMIGDYITDANIATITNTKNITLDLNGHQIVVNNDKLVINNGALTIEDSTSVANSDGIKEGTGTIISNNGVIVENNKELIIESGMFTSNSNYITKDYIINNRVVESGTGNIISKVTINNGVFNKPFVYQNDLTKFYSIVKNDGLLTINNGHFSNFGHMDQYGDSLAVGYIMNTNTLVINDGLFETSGDSSAIMNSYKTTINDGTFKSISGFSTKLFNNESGSFDILGGSFETAGTGTGGMVKNKDQMTISGITSSFRMIGSNSGTLTISNSTFNALDFVERIPVLDNTGHLTLTGGSYTGDFDISNHGTGDLTINSSTITNTGNGGINCFENSTATFNSINYTSSYTRTAMNVYGYSSVTINGGTMTETVQTDVYHDPFINLYGSATLDIVDGTISSELDYGVAVSESSTLTIGTSGGTPDTTNPVIYGRVYGLLHSDLTSNVNFYDGVIKGRTNSVSGTITETELNYKETRDQVTEGGVTTMNSTLTVIGSTESVAMVGTINFLSLQSAINYASNNHIEAVQLHQTLVLEEPLVLPAGGDPVKIYKGIYSISPEEYYNVTGISVVEGTAPSASLSRFLANITGSEINPKNIIIFEMSDGNKLQPNEIYKLYKIMDNSEKIVKVNENNIGDYDIGTSTDELRTVDGKIFINGLGEGNYKLVSENRVLNFTISYEGVSSNIRENNSIKISRTTSAIATLILQLQTGMIRSPYILIIMIMIICILGFIAYQKYKKEEN